MTAWLIILFVIGPLLVFTGWVVIRQLRGGFDEPEPEATEPDFLQRHVWIAAALILAILGFKIGGLVGLFMGPLVGVVLFAVLAPVGALLATIIESPEHRSSHEEKPSLEHEAASPGPSPRREPFQSRFVRNLRRAVREGPRFWG